MRALLPSPAVCRVPCGPRTCLLALVHLAQWECTQGQFLQWDKSKRLPSSTKPRPTGVHGKSRWASWVVLRQARMHLGLQGWTGAGCVLKCVEADWELMPTCPAAPEHAQARQAPARVPQPATSALQASAQDWCVARASVAISTCGDTDVVSGAAGRGSQRERRRTHSRCRYDAVPSLSKSRTCECVRTLKASRPGQRLARQAVPVLLGGDQEQQTQRQVEQVQAGHGH